MNKVAIITGGSSGIGLCTAAALREAGCRIFFTDCCPAPGGQANRLPSVDFLIGDDGVIHPPAP